MRDPELAGATPCQPRCLVWGSLGGQRNRQPPYSCCLVVQALGVPGNFCSSLLHFTCHAGRSAETCCHRQVYVRNWPGNVMICPLLGQQQDSSKVEEEVEQKKKIRPRYSHLPETPGHLLCCTGAKSMNVQGPCPSRHHHTTPDQMHETCSSHVECASRDWSLGRDKAQEATSLTTALVLAGNDKIFCPHKPRQRGWWAERKRTEQQTSRHSQCPMCLPRINCASMQYADIIATATATDSPIALLATLHVESCLLAAPTLPHSHTPSPPPTSLGRSLSTFAASGCRKTVQCASQKQGGSFVKGR